MFLLLLSYQNANLDANTVRHRLIQSGEVHEIGRWRAEFFRCATPGQPLSACASLGTTDVALPGRPALQQTIRSLPSPPTRVRLTHDVDEGDAAWLATDGAPVLSVTRFVQNWTRLEAPGPGQIAIGYGANVSYAFDKNALLRERTLALEVDFTDHDWFGPVAFPVALVKALALRTWEALPTLADSSAHLGKQLEIALPLTLVDRKSTRLNSSH